MDEPISTEFRIYINELGHQPIDLLIQVSIYQDSAGRFHFESIREKVYANDEWHGRPCTVGYVEKKDEGYYRDYYEVSSYLFTTDERNSARQAKYLIYIVYIPEYNAWHWSHLAGRSDGPTKFVVKERDTTEAWDNRAQPPPPVCGMDSDRV